MLFDNRRIKTIVLALILSLTISGFVSAQDQVIDLTFSEPPYSGSEISRTLQSLIKIQGTGGLCPDGLYLMTHYGDREEMFEKENRKCIDHPMIKETWRFCSVFCTATDDSVIMGRNWDNQNVGSVVVSLYHPPKGYSSISFCRAIDLGYPLNLDLEEIRSTEIGSRLVIAPFYVMDGVNEHGLAAAITGVRQTNHQPKADEELVSITFLVRKILDQARNIVEAVNLVEKFVPFDLDKNSLNAHLFIVDSSGRSVVLEYVQDQWKEIYGDESWQVLTNKPVYNVPDTILREECWRYRNISETLENTKGNVGWKAGMKILQDVTQKGTAWSVVYSPTTEDLYFSVYQKWDNIYHLIMP